MVCYNILVFGKENINKNAFCSYPVKEYENTYLFFHCTHLFPRDFTNINALILLYSVTDKNSFDFLIDHIDLPIPVPTILVGTDVDIENNRKVTTKEGENRAKKLGVNFLESSPRVPFLLFEFLDTLIEELEKEILEIPEPKGKKCVIM